MPQINGASQWEGKKVVVELNKQASPARTDPVFHLQHRRKKAGLGEGADSEVMGAPLAEVRGGLGS